MKLAAETGVPQTNTIPPKAPPPLKGVFTTANGVEIPLIDASAAAMPNNNNNLQAAPSVSIQPPFLDWGEQPLCEPSTRTVSVINTSPDTELLVLSLSTDNIVFYPKGNFYQESVAPGKRMSIDVEYLPRTLGSSEGTLIVQTSVGGFLIQMRGSGTPSPYHVSPLLNAKVPSGSAHGYELRLYNPHDKVLKVLEVFTEEEFLSLKLPTGGPDGNADSQDTGGQAMKGTAWEVPPRETRTVIKLEFRTATPGKYQGVVMVNTTATMLAVPIDVHAVKGGIHRTPEELDFGTLTNPSEVQHRDLLLLHSGNTYVSVLDVFANPPDPMLIVSFNKGMLLRPGVETKVATLSYAGKVEGRVTSRVMGRAMSCVVFVICCSKYVRFVPKT